MKVINLASSNFPTGQSWLANFFLEIQVMIYDFEPENYCRGVGIGQWELHEHKRHLQRWMPVLADRTTFTFDPSLQIEACEEFPSALNLDRPTILVVRDDRDVVYSQMKRDGFGGALEEFVRLPFPLLGIPAVLENALCNELWMEMVPQDRLHLVRFEDLKTSPEATVAALLQFLGIHRGAASIDRAIASCSLDRARSAANRFGGGGASGAKVRRGQAHEWKEHMSPSQQSLFTGFPEGVRSRLGYDVSTAVEPDRDPPSFARPALDALANSWTSYLFDRNPPRCTSARRQDYRRVLGLSVERMWGAAWLRFQAANICLDVGSPDLANQILTTLDKAAASDDLLEACAALMRYRMSPGPRADLDETLRTVQSPAAREHAFTVSLDQIGVVHSLRVWSVLFPDRGHSRAIMAIFALAYRRFAARLARDLPRGVFCVFLRLVERLRARVGAY